MRIAQWDRYCFENYLLEDEVIYDVLKEPSPEPTESRVALRAMMKDIALGQLRDIVAREQYAAFMYENSGLRASEVDGLRDYKEIGTVLAKRLTTVQTQLAAHDEANWVRDFDQKCVVRDTALEAEWNYKRQLRCDGKRLLVEMHKQLGLKCRWPT